MSDNNVKIYYIESHFYFNLSTFTCAINEILDLNEEHILGITLIDGITKDKKEVSNPVVIKLVSYDEDIIEHLYRYFCNKMQYIIDNPFFEDNNLIIIEIYSYIPK